MIISDRHRLAFVHIPKCAGSSVRRQIAAFDDAGGAFADVRPHDGLGWIDHGHIPLAVLQSHFPEVLEKLRAYTTYALIRDPLARFGSALRQTLHFYEGRTPAEMSAAELRGHTERLIARLRAGEAPLDPKLIFFARQTDFVDLDGERIADRLFPVERTADLIRELSQRLGTPLDPERRANRDLSFRLPALVRPAYALNALFFRHAPPWLHERIKRAVVPLLTRGTSATRQLGLTEDRTVRDFVADHYAADIRLHRSLVDTHSAAA